MRARSSSPSSSSSSSSSSSYPEEWSSSYTKPPPLPSEKQPPDRNLPLLAALTRGSADPCHPSPSMCVRARLGTQGFSLSSFLRRLTFPRLPPALAPPEDPCCLRANLPALAPLFLLSIILSRGMPILLFSRAREDARLPGALRQTTWALRT